MKEKKLLIFCGGTGGHFYPGLSIARVAKQSRAFEVVIILSGKHASKQQKICQNYGLNSVIIKSVTLPVKKWQYPLFLLKLFWAIIKAIKVIFSAKVDVVLTMGSFASVPLGIATKFLGKRFFLHEGNVIVGRANRLLSYFARAIFISFPLKYPKSVFCQQLLFGMPLRPELLFEKNKSLFDDFDDDLPVILLFGGSQGARKLNEAFLDFAQSTKNDFRVIHLTGCEDNSSLQELYKRNEIKASVMPYFENMASLYKSADLVICRSGASTLAELAYFEKASLLIPFASSADNHQKYNANYAKIFEACIVLEEDKLDQLSVIVTGLLENRQKLRKLRKNMGGLKMEFSAQKIIEKMKV